MEHGDRDIVPPNIYILCPVEEESPQGFSP